MSLLVLLSLSLLVLGCKSKKPGPGNTEEEPNQVHQPAPAFSVGPKTEGALYTWVDDQGSFHITETPNDIPQAARKQVRVVVDGKSVGSPQYVYVADLTDVSDGKYTLMSMPRDEWESVGKAGRDKQVAALKPKAEPSASSKLADLGVDAIIYGADWCKPCHLAEDYLKSKGVKVIKKDIEEDPSAGAEMRQVLKSAGLSGSSIPVLNVGGTILRGFSAKAIDQALERAKKK